MAARVVSYLQNNRSSSLRKITKFQHIYKEKIKSEILCFFFTKTKFHQKRLGQVRLDLVGCQLDVVMLAWFRLCLVM